MRDPLRTVILRPYRAGMGPSFILRTFDTGRTDAMGKYRLAYRLTMRAGRTSTVLFDGEDFCCSPLHAIDADQTMAALLGFLTLRPGDTDREYFANYSADQLAYCDQYAEALSCEVDARFGEDH